MWPSSRCGLADRSGLLVAGGITGGIGLAAVGPGVYLLVTSGSHADVRSDGVPVESRLEPPGLGVGATF